MVQRRSGGREQGFIVSLELILIITLVVIGLFAGCVALRNAVVRILLEKRTRTLVVVDSADPPSILGRAVGFDEHEAPRIFYVDRTDPTTPYRVLTGVRDDRFTTRQQVFYTADACTGSPCIVAPSAEGSWLPGNWTPNLSGALVDRDRVSYLYEMQLGPSYAIGADVDQTFNGLRLPGTLYRSTATACDASTIVSVWTSQEVVAGEPCRSVSLETDTFDCSGVFGGSTCSDVCVPGVPPTTCACPPGATIEPVTGECCAAGTVPSGTPGRCVRSGLVDAELVLDDLGNNLTSTTVPPFKVTLPSPDVSLVLTPPTSGEGTTP